MASRCIFCNLYIHVISAFCAPYSHSDPILEYYMADASCRLASLGRPCRYALPSSTSVTSPCRFQQLKLSWHPMCEAPAQIISRKPMV